MSGGSGGGGGGGGGNVVVLAADNDADLLLILDVARLLVRRPDDDADRLGAATARAVDQASDAQAPGTISTDPTQRSSVASVFIVTRREWRTSLVSRSIVRPCLRFDSRA